MPIRFVVESAETAWQMQKAHIAVWARLCGLAEKRHGGSTQVAVVTDEAHVAKHIFCGCLLLAWVNAPNTDAPSPKGHIYFKSAMNMSIAFFVTCCITTMCDTF